MYILQGLLGFNFDSCLPRAMSVAASFCAPWTLQTRWAGPFHQLRPPMIMSAEGSQPRRRRRPSRPKKQSSQFERSVDDLVGKRMGRGYIYYGERTGGRAGEEADAVAAAEAASAAETGQLSDEEFLKDDAILVAGGCGRTGQWITLGLVNQGFNVRVLTRDFDRAEKLFGPSGSNGKYIGEQFLQQCPLECQRRLIRLHDPDPRELSSASDIFLPC